MDNQELNILLDIKEKLGEMDGRLRSVCSKIDFLKEKASITETKVDALPCEAHTKEMLIAVNSRVPWRHFLWVLAVIGGILAASFTFTYDVEHKIDLHANQQPHYYQIYKDLEEIP